MKIAAAAYPPNWLDSFSAWADKMADWVGQGAAQGADLLVFPEYASLELASLGGPAVAADLEASLHEVARHEAGVAEVLDALARRHGVHILGASAPHFGGGRPVNRAVLHGPGGVVGHQDKLVMTRFEREQWDVVPGQGLRVFDLGGVGVGILICYDSEFPLLGRALVEAGAEVILVPSCTDTVAGWNRVRVGAMARALEGQCVTVQAPTVGDCPWSPAIDENRGAAAIYGPPDRGFPETGVLAQGAMDTPGWVVADVDPAAIRRVRAEGGVLNMAHWPEQAARL